MIAAGLFAASVLVSEFHSAATPTTSPVPVLVYIGAVLALTGSVSFGFVVYLLNYANNRKNDLYFKFKAGLFEFDRFLKDYPATVHLVDDAAELSWELKKLRNTDFPLMDWEDRLKGLAAYWNNDCPAYSGDIHLENKILGYLAYFEELVSEIGIMCIRQILVGVYSNIVRKIFALLATLVLVVVAATAFPGQWFTGIINSIPVFYGTFVALVLLEVSWAIHQESDEILDFVDRGDDEGESELAPKGEA